MPAKQREMMKNISKSAQCIPDDNDSLNLSQTGQQKLRGSEACETWCEALCNTARHGARHCVMSKIRCYKDVPLDVFP
jgi:hypothetical protein